MDGKEVEPMYRYFVSFFVQKERKDGTVVMERAEASFVTVMFKITRAEHVFAILNKISENLNLPRDEGYVLTMNNWQFLGLDHGKVEPNGKGA